MTQTTNFEAKPHGSHLKGLQLTAVIDSRNNNFNLIRFTAAVVVVFSHCFHITGNDHLEPMENSSGLTMGYVSVGVFFFTSGMLITKSWLSMENLPAFMIARISRIYPALWLSLVLCILVVGLWCTNLNALEFLQNSQVWEYAIVNGTLVSARYELPGVFRDNITNNVNGPLWTLPFEIQCYGLVAALGITKLLHYRRAVMAFLFVFALASIGLRMGFFEIRHPRIQSTVVLTTLFLSGAAAYLFRDGITLTKRTALMFLSLPVAAGLVSGGLFRISLDISIPYLTLFAAYVPAGAVRQFNRLGDYSYGVYIFGWPIQQVVVSVWPEIHWFNLFLVAMPVILVTAILSWHLVESKALKCGRGLSQLWRDRKLSTLSQT